ncbi:MAG: hypothetical protein KAU50_02965, partial [Candidatus Marinimicrobia bacterium]|nr:hypothetical protein [Candidatus Neomarinimicrobiota bacterium]
MKRLYTIALTALFLPLSLCAQYYTPELIFYAVGQKAGDAFGVQVLGIGDQNGDRHNDILISSGYGHNIPRIAQLFYGGNPMDTIPDFQWNYDDGSMYCIGDVNGDSILDYVIQNNLYFGSTSPHTAPDVILPYNTLFDSHYSPTPVGDINADGYDDMVMSTIDYPRYRGFLKLYYGGPAMDTIPELSWVGETNNTKLRYGSPYPADFNHDGYDDLFLQRGDDTERVIENYYR